MASAKRATGMVKSADRLMAVFEYLAEHGTGTLAEIARDLELPTSSAYELLATALRRRFLALDDGTRTYRLGMRFKQIAQSTVGDAPLVELAQPLMDKLVAITQETVQLAELEGISNRYLAISESPHPMKLVSAVGSHLPAHTTGLGKALLAGLPDEEIRRRLEGVELEAVTENTITDPEELVREVQRIRQHGFGEDREEYVVGCRCIAMPIHGPAGDVVAAMSISVPTPRLTPRLERTIHEELRGAVTELEVALRS